MAYSFPMVLSDFFDGLPIQTSVPDLGEALDYSQTGAGEVITADLGPRLWKMDVSIRLGYYAEIEQIKAKLNVLRRAGSSLLVHSMPLIAPQYDPTGSILGANVIRMTAVAPNNREITLSGFPPGYELTVGDFLSYTYGSNPVRYAMHQIAQTKQANNDGVISNIEVTEFIRPGWAANVQVKLIKPVFKAVVVPGSTNPGKSGQRITDGLSFSVVQTLR